jgi:hypothetical protein
MIIYQSLFCPPLLFLITKQKFKQITHFQLEPNLQSKDMAEVWAQGITVDDNNNEPDKVNAEIHVHVSMWLFHASCISQTS